MALQLLLVRMDKNMKSALMSGLLEIIFDSEQAVERFGPWLVKACIAILLLCILWRKLNARI